MPDLRCVESLHIFKLLHIEFGILRAYVELNLGSLPEYLHVGFQGCSWQGLIDQNRNERRVVGEFTLPSDTWATFVALLVMGGAQRNNRGTGTK